MASIEQTQTTNLSIMRGGRLTKIDKRTASYAPLVGMAKAPELFGVSGARAANECGTEKLADQPDMITCGAGRYAGDIACSGPGKLPLSLDDPMIDIEGPGVTVSSSAVVGGDTFVMGSDYDKSTTIGTNTAGNSAIAMNITTGNTGGPRSY